MNTIKSSLALSVLISGILFTIINPITYSKESSGNSKADILLRIQTETGESSVIKAGRAEGDEEESLTTVTPTESPETGNSSNTSTDIKQCDTEVGCCYQYTWPGPEVDGQKNYSFTCNSYYRTQGRSNPCKEPIVYTRSKLWNETRFCGTVLRDGDTLENGCFTEKLPGFNREICVCSGNSCNPATNLIPASALACFAAVFSVYVSLRRSNTVLV